MKREGIFLLRYRTFDIFSFVSGTSKRPIQAELYGGSFKVYSTRDFPGLQASTELTKVSIATHYRKSIAYDLKLPPPSLCLVLESV